VTLQKQKQEKMHQNKKHTPVLLDQVLHYLDPKSGESYLDLTAGYAGHANAVLEKTSNFTSSVLVDRDKDAVKALKKSFAEKGVKIIENNFLDASLKLLGKGQCFDLILADLGVSSPHLNEASRGFAFNQTGPLDMRMDQSQELTASVIVNSYAEKDIEEILKKYGEEPKSRLIAKLIVQNRPIKDTTELAKIVARAWPGHSKAHPATRSFQAIRIAVNDELKQLAEGLKLWVELLCPGGRIVVISYHSLEDRLVKQAFKELGGDRYDSVLKILNKQPVVSDKTEIVFNPRARSAKLRAAAKINNRKGSSHANSGTK